LRGQKGADSILLLGCDAFITSGAVPYDITFVDNKVTFASLPGPTKKLEDLYGKLQGMSLLRDTLQEDQSAMEQWVAAHLKTVDEINRITRYVAEHIDKYPALEETKAELRSTKKSKKRIGEDDHLYDSEQSIMRCLDAYFSQERLDLAPYDFLTLHVQNRFDTCRYCLKSMHDRIMSDSHWKKRLNGKKLMTFIGSRESYKIDGTLASLGAEYYNMRFIGWDDNSDKSFAAAVDSTLVDKGIIFQKTIPDALQMEIAKKLKVEADEAAAKAIADVEGAGGAAAGAAGGTGGGAAAAAAAGGAGAES
jgi:hypothetical protein